MNATEKYRRTKKGMVTNLYHKMKGRNTVSFQLKDLHEFASCPKFDRLFNEWEKRKYHKQLKPSIDRISNKIGYTLENIQWLTWAENRYKQSMERRSRNGAVIQMLAGKPFKYYKSQREAVKKTGLNQSGISNCLTGKRKTCGGYEWKYKVIGNIHENKDLV
jgi:hypothetical protein